MDYDLTDEQIMMRDSLRKMLEDQSSVKLVREMEQDPDGHPKALWQSLADMGITGLLVPEEFGGLGMTYIDLTVAFEELGRALSPAPTLETCVIASGIIAAAGSDEQKQQWLPKIAAGETVLTPAIFELDGGYNAAGIQLRAELGDEGYRVNGSKIFVSFASVADRLLTFVRTGEGVEDIDILLIDPKAPGVTLTKTQSHALDPRFKVTFDNVLVPAADRIGAAGSGWKTWCDVGYDVMIAQSAWFAGCGNKATELTAVYSVEREQFDRPIGSFQSVAHQLANSLTGVRGARYMAWKAAWAKDSGKPYRCLATMAHLEAAESGRYATRTGHQIFGGIGFTNDIDIQLYYRRTKQNMFAWFDAKNLEDLVASYVIDGEEN